MNECVTAHKASNITNISKVVKLHQLDKCDNPNNNILALCAITQEIVSLQMFSISGMQMDGDICIISNYICFGEIQTQSQAKNNL